MTDPTPKPRRPRLTRPVRAGARYFRANAGELHIAVAQPDGAKQRRDLAAFVGWLQRFADTCADMAADDPPPPPPPAPLFEATAPAPTPGENHDQSPA